MSEGGEARNHEAEVEAVARLLWPNIDAYAGEVKSRLEGEAEDVIAALDAVRCAQGRDTGNHEALRPLSAEDDERHARWEFEQSRSQRKSIAWCGECGNVSVDGVNFARVEGGLQCAGCGAISPHFEYIRRSSQGRDTDALALLRAAHGEAVTHELHGKIGRFLAAQARGRDTDAPERCPQAEVEAILRSVYTDEEGTVSSRRDVNEAIRECLQILAERSPQGEDHEAIAVCQNPNGEGQYVPADSIVGARCFMPDCECTPKVYVPAPFPERLGELLDGETK